VTRTEFKLTMPGRSSWNGAWSGDDRDFVIAREVDDEVAARIDGNAWSCRWSDGWAAQIAARVAIVDSRRAKSDGFCGYDWRVDGILLRHGEIYADHERPEAGS